MKRLLILGLALLTTMQLRAQLAVTAPTLEVSTALNHIEQMQQAVQTYQTIAGVEQGIAKTIEAVEKVNNQLMTVRDVQEIATRSALCINRIQKTYNMISSMKLDLRSTTELLGQCNQCTRECVGLTAYGSKIFTNNFLKMNDKDRLDETRRLLDEIDKLLSRVGYISTQAKAIEFNNQMINAYIR